MTIMVPVNKADDLGIRAIVGKKEAQKALRLIAEEFEPIPADWKLRYQMNLDLLKKGSILDIANVVRALYHRSRIKELPILERKLYDSALRLLIDEVSFSLLKSKDDVEELVFARLKVNDEVIPALRGDRDGRRGEPADGRPAKKEFRRSAACPCSRAPSALPLRGRLPVVVTVPAGPRRRGGAARPPPRRRGAPLVEGGDTARNPSGRGSAPSRMTRPISC